MALLRQLYTNFTSGEVTPLFSARIDAAAYKNGVKDLENFRILAQGGIKRRPGLRKRYNVGLGTSYATQLIPYVYDEDEAYLILFASTGSTKFIQAFDPTKETFAISTTGTAGDWTAAGIVGNLKYAQSGDTMIVVHPDMPMLVLTRTSATEFARSDFTFDTSGGFIHQPYYKFVDPAVTLTPANTGTSNQTITASASIFSSAWVGEEIEYTDSAGTIHHIAVVAYLSGTTITGKFDTAPSNTNARTTWKEQVFSSRHGYARSVAFHDQRLVFGGSRDLPNHIFMSKVGEFFNFDVGTGLDDESIQIQIAENQVSEIKAVESFRHLSIFTSEAELYVPTSENRPLTPSTISVKRQTSYGSSGVNPVDFDGALVYLTKSKGAVREFVFSDLSQAYNSDAISLLSQEMIGTIVDMSAQREAPDQAEAYLYTVNSDGNMAVMVSIRKEQVQGWMQYTTDGTFQNVATVNRRVFALVRRDMPLGNGNTESRLFIEEFDNSYHLDCAEKQTNGSAITNWTITAESGLLNYPDIRNRDVSVKSGNFALGSFPANNSGEITLNDAVTEVEIGIPYTPTMTTLPPEFTLQDGITVGQKRRIVRAVLDLNESLNVKTKGTNILIRRVTDDLSLQPTPLTTRKEVYLLGWSSEGTVTVTQDQPLPLTLNGLLLEVEV